MKKQFLSIILLMAILSSLTVTQGNATYNSGPPAYLGEVKVGVILPTNDLLEKDTILLKQIAEPEINSWLRMTGTRAWVNFVITSADGSSDNHYALVQQFKQDGVDLIIGGYWSSQASGSLQYVKDNGMLMFSPSSTGPNLDTPNDGLYRMCAPEDMNLVALSDMITRFGIQKIILIEESGWTQDYSQYFKSRNKLPILDEIVYSTVRDPNTWVIDPVASEPYQIQALERAVAAASKCPFGKIGVVVLNEDPYLFSVASNYRRIYNLNWFLYGGGDVQHIAPLESAHLHLFNALCNVPTNSQSKFNVLQTKANMALNVYDGYLYDIAWVIARSVKFANSKVGTKVIAVLPHVSSNYLGVTGYCKLNRNGDRSNPYYDYLGYVIPTPPPDPLESSLVKYGYCDYQTGISRWLRPY